MYLNGRITAGSKVIILNFTSDWTQLSEYIIEELTGYVVNEGSLTVVDRRNLDIIRQEMNFQLSGEVDDETAQSIGKKLGAQIIVSGSITAIGSTYRLRIRAISVETAQIQGMQNIDVVQDSRLAALTGTAYTGATAAAMPITTTTISPNNAQSANFVIAPGAGWEPASDGNSTAKFNIGREYIEGQEREVLILEVELKSKNGYKYGQFILKNETVLQKIRSGTGVKLKILGDGKPWYLKFAMKATDKDFAHYEKIITTKKGKVLEVNIPYSQLRQPDWGYKVRFNKNEIIYLVLERGSHTQTGSSTIKVFELEIY
jgi:TolB-like protein